MRTYYEVYVYLCPLYRFRRFTVKNIFSLMLRGIMTCNEVWRAVVKNISSLPTVHPSPIIYIYICFIFANFFIYFSSFFVCFLGFIKKCDLCDMV